MPYLSFVNGKLTARVFQNGTDGDAIATAPTTPATGVWTHVAQTWSSSTGVKLYVDGQLVASHDALTNDIVPEPYLTLGSSWGQCGGPGRTDVGYKGEMDDARAYTLLGALVGQVMRASKGKAIRS